MHHQIAEPLGSVLPSSLHPPKPSKPARNSNVCLASLAIHTSWDMHCHFITASQVGASDSKCIRMRIPAYENDRRRRLVRRVRRLVVLEPPEEVPRLVACRASTVVTVNMRGTVRVGTRKISQGYARWLMHRNQVSWHQGGCTVRCHPSKVPLLKDAALQT